MGRVERVQLVPVKDSRAIVEMISGASRPLVPTAVIELRHLT